MPVSLSLSGGSISSGCGGCDAQVLIPMMSETGGVSLCGVTLSHNNPVSSFGLFIPMGSDSLTTSDGNTFKVVS